MTFWLVDESVMEGTPLEDLKPYILLRKNAEYDWSRARERRVIRMALEAEDPDIPPEEAINRAEVIWKVIGGIEEEDIFCILERKNNRPSRVHFCEVVGDIDYNHAEKAYMIPVKWFEQKAGMFRLFKHRLDLNDATDWPEAIGAKKLKQDLRNHLPLPGNWFVRWRWLIFLIIFVKVVVIGGRIYNKM